MFLNETNKNSRLYGMQEFILKNNSTPCCAVHWAVYNNMAWWERNLEIFTDFRVIGSNIGDKMFTHANQPIAIVVWMYTKIQGKLSNCVPKMMTSMWSTMMSKYLWKARREGYLILNCWIKNELLHMFNMYYICKVHIVSSRKIESNL